MLLLLGNSLGNFRRQFISREQTFSWCLILKGFCQGFPYSKALNNVSNSTHTQIKKTYFFRIGLFLISTIGEIHRWIFRPSFIEMILQGPCHSLNSTNQPFPWTTNHTATNIRFGKQLQAQNSKYSFSVTPTYTWDAFTQKRQAPNKFESRNKKFLPQGTDVQKRGSNLCIMTVLEHLAI